MYVKYPNIVMEQRNSAKIRGYFSNRFIENIETHNHLEDNFLYKYPKIQYKSLKNRPFIIGIEDNIPILHKAIMETEQIIIGDEIYNCKDIDIKLETRVFIISLYPF